jgi:uncharacterized protein (DUF608 family)
MKKIQYRVGSMTTPILNANWVWIAAGVISATLSGTLPCHAGDDASSAKVQQILKQLQDGSNGKTPTVKDFNAGWVSTLDQRGEPTVYTRANSKNFEFIGMPVGGIGAGLLYLGGDGKLWGWDIFNTKASGQTRQDNGFKNPYGRSEKNNPAYYALEQGFAVRIDQGGKQTTRTLDRDGFKDIRFRGEYPVGFVSYADPECPVQVKLEAFSPFCPIDLDASAYPATILNYTIKNNSDRTVSGDLTGFLQNAVCIESGKEKPGIILRQNRVITGKKKTLVEFTAGTKSQASGAAARPEIVFDDFEQPKYNKWAVTGTAFGDGPVAKVELPAYLSNINVKGKRAVVTHNTRKSEGIAEADAHQGTMTSPEFTIERKLIGFLIGGGNHPGKTCINLQVDGQTAQSATGKNSNELRMEYFDVSKLQGKKARLKIVDELAGDWANLSIDHIVFCDAIPDTTDDWLKSRVDYGSMALALIGGGATVKATADFKAPEGTLNTRAPDAERPCGEPAPVGALARTFTLKPGEEATACFVLAWHFPRYRGTALNTPTDRSYGERFASARAVADDVVTNIEKLTTQTKAWHDTWYDSTLPWWFLDRTFANTCILASNTSFLFSGGRFFGFEGEYLGYGTATHVWGYVQAMGRVFPALERSLREQVDYNPKVAFDAKTGGIGQRGEQVRDPADDGQASIILRTLLVHQMQPDKKFLTGIYPQMKQAMNFLVNDQDLDRDGIMTNDQMNTLDARWYGKITWLSLYYGSALRAAAEMADAMNDAAAATEWRAIADRGRKLIETRLFNGEYFIHEQDPAHAKDPQGSYDGCEIDQLLGQSWAYQVGLGPIIDPSKAQKALDSLWRYTFTTDVGPYRKEFPKGRWFAEAGDGGFFICSWPRGCPEWLKNDGAFFAGYMNECMSGFEYALSSLMMWDGMPYRSLAHTRIMCERYDGSKRNPWNEVEWGSFYGRAMASYGVFTAACGFKYSGPDHSIAFAPRLTPEKFKAAFTAAEGWGTFEQSRAAQVLRETIRVNWGKLGVRKLAFDLPAGAKVGTVTVVFGGKPCPAQVTQSGNRVDLILADLVVLNAGQALEIAIVYK